MMPFLQRVTNTGCSKSSGTKIVFTFQANTTLFMNRWLGGVKRALNMVDNNLNNFCSPFIVISAYGVMYVR